MAEDNSREHDDQKSRHTSADSAGLGLQNADVAGGNEAVPYSSALIGDGRLNGRGNSTVKAAVMRQAQQTHGNHGVQRMLQRSINVQRDTPPTQAPTPAGPAQAGNPLVAAMWEAAVHQPVVQATTEMQGNPNKAKMQDADSKLNTAQSTMHQAIAAVPAGPKNDLPIAQAKTVSNALVAISKEIEPHIGKIAPVADIQPQLAAVSEHVAQAGDALSKTDPNPAGSNANGATPAAPSTSTPTPAATTQ